MRYSDFSFATYANLHMHLCVDLFLEREEGKKENFRILFTCLGETVHSRGRPMIACDRVHFFFLRHNTRLEYTRE